MNRWASGEISSFKYLSLVRYPTFPSIAVADFQACRPKPFVQLDESFVIGGPESEPLPPDLFVMPVYYVLAGGRDPATVYQNRKALEEREDIGIWLTSASDQELPDPLPFREGHLRRTPFAPRAVARGEQPLTKDERIIFCGALKVEHEQRFAFVTEKGSWAVVRVAEKGQEESASIHASVVASGHVPVDGWNFAIARSELVRCNGQALGVVRQKAQALTDVSVWSAAISGNCCQISETTLGTFRVGGDVQITVLTIVPARIVCFEYSEKWNITAIGCEDAKVRIRQNQTGMKVATVLLDGEVPARILITKGWGFIVVLTDESIWVFTVNGILVRKIEFPERIVQWFTLRIPPGFDSVGVNVNGKLRYFEAGERAPLENVEFEGGAVSQWTYLWRYDSFLVVCTNGKLLVLPRNQSKSE
jgi:hypothetical protein